MSTIVPQKQTIQKLLGNAEFGIDFYQREYEWERRNIEELLEDFESSFWSLHNPNNRRGDVRQYPRYFLGTIISFTKNGKKQIVDGQQRLTTLTLLLIYFHHQRKDNEEITDVSRMIYSESFGEKSFNIDVAERNSCMQALFNTGEFEPIGERDLSVSNLVARFSDIEDVFPDTLKDETLPYFVDWVINNVDLVELETTTDNDAFTVFETMNDRGVSLGPVDMLRGYLLAGINRGEGDDLQTQTHHANRLWKDKIVDLAKLKPKEDQNFFKIWFRAKYAESIRERHKGAANKDFEDINQFHRWTRNNVCKLGLSNPRDFNDFIVNKFEYFASYFVQIRHASMSFTTDMEEIYYNNFVNFTFQYMLMLAPLRLDEASEIANAKIKLVSVFVDIYTARRIVNSKRITYNTVRDSMFGLMNDIRDVCIDKLRDKLIEYLGNMQEGFNGISQFNLHRRNSKMVRYLLARITSHIEIKSGQNSDFYTFTSGTGTPFEIEHIWSDKFERHQDEFETENDFRRNRNYVGGLVLLPRGTNQSFGAAAYEEKVKHYVKENLLAASLSSLTYERNPNFEKFVKSSDLPFKPHPQFKRADLMQRQKLYRQICEQIWSPDRLNSAAST